MSPLLTFQNSYPLVMLPPRGPTCWFPISETRVVRQDVGGLWAIGLILCIIGIVIWPLLLVGVMLLWMASEQGKPTTVQYQRSREQRTQQAIASLPKGDAPEGRFDAHLASLVQQHVHGLLALRLGPHLALLTALNRFPDLVLITTGGYLVAVEVDEPWYWDRRAQCRRLSHDAEEDKRKTQEFLNAGLIVVRLAEQQIAEHPAKCLQLLQGIVHLLLNPSVPAPDQFYRQLCWQESRIELYRDPNRRHWERPSKPINNG